MNNRVCCVFVGLCVAFGWGCDRTEESAEPERPEPVEVKSPPPAFDRAVLKAENVVLGGLKRSVAASTHTSSKSDSDAEGPPEGESVSIVFSANVHGEREDCGCRKNPLGGLTRRHRLIELAEGDADTAAQKWWGAAAHAPNAVFVADAGDLLFKTTTLDRTAPGKQEEARYDAESVVRAMRHSPPDAFLVGEHDLALGLDEVKRLEKMANFPFVSANVRREGGELVWPGHVVVERGGVETAFVGVTKETTRFDDYWAKRELEVDDPFDAYLREIAKIQDDVDVVVLLSNLGTPRTQRLARRLHDEEVRVDVALVSNTNQLTVQPRWVGGVPVLEPLSRGKYLGRVDIVLVGEGPPRYANAVSDGRTLAEEYRKAWAAYADARRGRNQLLARLQRIGEQMSELENAPTDAGAKARARLEAKRKRNIERQRRRLEIYEGRVEIASEKLREVTAELDEAEDSGPIGGDDWFEARIVQVKLEIEQNAKVRRYLDRRKKNRPRYEPKRRGIHRKVRRRAGDGE